MCIEMQSYTHFTPESQDEAADDKKAAVLAAAFEQDDIQRVVIPSPCRFAASLSLGERGGPLPPQGEGGPKGRMRAEPQANFGSSSPLA